MSDEIVIQRFLDAVPMRGATSAEIAAHAEAHGHVTVHTNSEGMRSIVLDPWDSGAERKKPRQP